MKLTEEVDKDCNLYYGRHLHLFKKKPTMKFLKSLLQRVIVWLSFGICWWVQTKCVSFPAVAPEYVPAEKKKCLFSWKNELISIFKQTNKHRVKKNLFNLEKEKHPNVQSTSYKEFKKLYRFNLTIRPVISNIEIWESRSA